MNNPIATYPTEKYTYTQHLSGIWKRTEETSSVDEILGIACYVPPINYRKLEEVLSKGNFPPKSLVQLIESNKLKIGSKPEGRVVWISYQNEQPRFRRSTPISAIESLDIEGDQVL